MEEGERHIRQIREMDGREDDEEEKVKGEMAFKWESDQ